MAKKGEILFYLKDGTPVIAADGPEGAVAVPDWASQDPKRTVGLSKTYVEPDPEIRNTKGGYFPLEPPVGNDGKPIHETKKQREEREAKNQMAQKLAMKAGDIPFSIDLDKLGPPKPEKTAEEKRKEFLNPNGLPDFWQGPTGGDKSDGPYGLDISPGQAATLENQLYYAQMRMELRYPGAVAQKHESGGTNLGEPEMTAEGGKAGAMGTNDWVYENGAPFTGSENITIVQVLDTYNIYN